MNRTPAGHAPDALATLTGAVQHATKMSDYHAFTLACILFSDLHEAGLRIVNADHHEETT